MQCVISIVQSLAEQPVVRLFQQLVKVTLLVLLCFCAFSETHRHITDRTVINTVYRCVIDSNNVVVTYHSSTVDKLPRW